jgi:DNA-binding transcriptional MerR regulator/methylmalonyl-CoA mutase cobalamin-binding subunit
LKDFSPYSSGGDFVQVVNSGGGYGGLSKEEWDGMKFVPVTEIEGVTGLSKEVIRKWELRYGFPRPLRDGNGERVYPLDQVERLRLVRRLLDSGLRPSKVVKLDKWALETLVAGVSLAGPVDSAPFQQELFAALKRHDPARISQLLHAEMQARGLEHFARQTIPQLNIMVGDAWLKGDLQIFEEHLYAQAITDILQVVHPAANAGLGGGPKILLTTMPGEIHVLGLLLARLVLTLHGANCLLLGAQTPISEIIKASLAMQVDVVGLSFSIAQPVRNVARFLGDLRNRLDPAIPIWAGGMGTARLPRHIPGVLAVQGFDEVVEELEAWPS